MSAKHLPVEVGTRFGDWTVIDQVVRDIAGKRNVSCSRVLCKCGTEKELENTRLRAGKSNGCGCRRGLALAYSGITHGKSHTAIYGLWASIKHRLTHQTTYAGIHMYEPWVKDFTLFETFILGLGPKPTASHTLDRIDPAGDYAPGNLRWADKTLQSNNRRNNILANLEKNSKVEAGKKYDMLTVLELSARWKHGRNWYAAKVRCDCGTVKTVLQRQLLSEKTKSCGCFKNRNLLLGPQAQEKPIMANGETHSLYEWARRTGMSPQTIWQRINTRGWSHDRAVTEPIGKGEVATINGETKTVYEWCQVNGVSYTAAYARIHKGGWDPAAAVSQPVRATKRLDVVIDGETLSLAEACRRTGMSYYIAYNRIHTLGWDATRAASEPVTPKTSGMLQKKETPPS